jgi:cystathionine beta-synthase
VRLIEAGRARRQALPGGTIVEPTSGNTGTGLAIAARLKGYRVIAVMPDKMSKEKIDLLRAYGARSSSPRPTSRPTRRSPTTASPTASSRRSRAPSSPTSTSTRPTRRRTTSRRGPELWEQTAGRITHLVVGVGTGRTVTGTGRYLKERNPDIKIIGADPVGSIYSNATCTRTWSRAWGRTSGPTPSTARSSTSGSRSATATPF